MHQALYRKYRPRVFDDVCGQDHVTSILRTEAERGTVSHAYLFAGSRGTGKTTCAKILAKVINCEHPVNGNPCNECEACRSIDDGTATDVIEMDAASETGVDSIRDLRDSVMYAPAMLKKRVYIIDEAHMLSTSAFNALLKTIEEPPEHVVFIFATTELHKVPATIISRCQRFEFRRIAVPVLASRLLYIAKTEDIPLTEDGATMIARLAQGGMRDSISLMELCSGTHRKIDPDLVSEILGTSPYERIAKVATAIAERDYASIFDTVAETVSSSKDLSVFWQDLTSFYRDMLLTCSMDNVGGYLDLTETELHLLEETAAKFGIPALISHCRILDETAKRIADAPQNKRLTVELALIRMCDEKLNASPDALLARIAALEDKITLLSHGEAVKEPGKPVEKKAEKAEPKPKKTVENAPPSPPCEVKRTRVGVWSEVVGKMADFDAAAHSFLARSACYDNGNGTYDVTVAGDFARTMLDNPATRKHLSDAMICCGIALRDESVLRFVTAEKTEIDDPISDLT